MQKYFIINETNKTYCLTMGLPGFFEDEWWASIGEFFPHVKGIEHLDVSIHTAWERDQINGLYYTYDLCSSGGYFTLFADVDVHSEEQIQAAAQKLYAERDVVSLTIKKLKKGSVGDLPVVEEGDGYLWWTAENAEELQTWMESWAGKELVIIRALPQCYSSQMIDVIFKLPKAKAQEILGYVPEDWEWLEM